MVWFLAALAILLGGGLFSLAVGRSPRLACLVGPIGMLLGGTLVLIQSAYVLLSGHSQSLRLAWPLPLASANMEIDPLSAVFALAIALIAMLAAIYGSGYLQGHAHHKNLGVSWFFFSLLAASMLLVVVARNGVLFLISWELMSLASFFLVIFEDEQESVRRAAWTYLVAMHIGTAFLIAMFLLLGANADSLDFERLSPGSTPSGVLFLLAVIGFGTKAGFIPMHVWLPEAHPAAPSHVSAVMSGVMIKTGIYGLLRTLTFLGEPAEWWGWTFLAIGVVSGVLGVLYAVSQHDLKRLLAYSSVENIGIMALGLGAGLLGICWNNPTMATLGFTGALLHVVNHAVFKSLLFLGAGSVLQATGTGRLDRLGGLLKRMPVTGATFLIGAAAISGLPPLNGFVGEFLIYLAAVAGLSGAAHVSSAWVLIGVFVIGGLALIGGLAAACFTKAFGIVFLGEPRSEEAAHAQEAGAAMRWPMMVLAGLCVLIGLSAPLWPLALQPAVAVVVPGQSAVSFWERVGDVGEEGADVATLGLEGSHALPLSPGERGDAVNCAVAPLCGVMFGSYILLGLAVLLAGVRKRLLAGRRTETGVTWGCGYVASTPRVQYTASSFTQPLALLFRLFLQPRDEIREPSGLFPRQAGLKTSTLDLFLRRVYEPLFIGIAWIASRLRWLQEGRIQIYVLYIALTILVLLIWKLR
jgi:hydrogenase-4 component B